MRNSRDCRRSDGTLMQALWRDKILYLMILPGLLSVLLFSYGPMFGLTIAFFDYDPIKGILQSPFVGMENFVKAFTDHYFRQAFLNTILIKLAQTAVTFPLSVLVALLLNEVGRRYKKIVQTASILPYFISWIVIASMFKNILGSQGLVNMVLKSWFGPGAAVAFLTDPQIFRWVIILQDTWKNVGYFALIYFSAIIAIDRSLYEAAYVDGAGRWKRMWYITLPGIRPTLYTMFIMLTGYFVVGPFDQIFAQYGPNVYKTVDIVETYTFRLGLSQYKYSFATAVGLVQGILATAIVLLTNLLIKKSNKESGML